MFKQKEKIFSNLNDKTESKAQKIEKKKKGIFNKILIGSLIAVSCLAMFSAVKVAKIQNVIDHNSTYFSAIENKQNAQKILFSDTYSDEDFKQDLHNFEVIKTSNVDNMFSYILFSGNQYDNPKLNVETYVEKIKSNTVKDYLKENVTDEKRLSQSLLLFGWNPMAHYFNNNLEQAFKDKYGDNSYFKYFNLKMDLAISKDNIGFDIKSQQDYKEFTKSQKEIYEKMNTAYENKDFETLRLYFKQYREYIKYISGIQYSSISTPKYSESNFTDKFISTAVFIPYVLIKDHEDYEKINKDIFLGM